MTEEKQNCNAFEENNKKGRIGILALPTEGLFYDDLLNELKRKGLTQEEAKNLLSTISFYESAYKKYVEIQGLESIEIDYFLKEGETAVLMDQLDGVLLTGGETLWPIEKTVIDDLPFFKTVYPNKEPYLDKIKEIVAKAKSINDSGRNFTLFCICLGFEALLLVETNMTYPIAYVRNRDINKRIRFTQTDSVIKQSLTSKQRKNAENKEMLYFFHDLGFRSKEFYQYKNLIDDYTICSTFYIDGFGECITSIEHKRYPFYATQFHPEKNLFDSCTAFNPFYSDDVVDVALGLGKLMISLNPFKNSLTNKTNRYVASFDVESKNTNVVVVSQDPRVCLLDNEYLF